MSYSNYPTEDNVYHGRYVTSIFACAVLLLKSTAAYPLQNDDIVRELMATAVTLSVEQFIDGSVGIGCSWMDELLRRDGFSRGMMTVETTSGVKILLLRLTAGNNTHIFYFMSNNIFLQNMTMSRSTLLVRVIVFRMKILAKFQQYKGAPHL